MPSIPEARTPVRNPTGPHPVRRRLPLHGGPTNGASPTSRSRPNPTTPPSSAKKKSTKTTVKKQKHVGKAAGAHHLPSPSLSPPPPPPPPSAIASGRRHTDTGGPLAFLDEVTPTTTTTTTPLRPSEVLDKEPPLRAPALHSAEMCLPDALTPAVAEAVMWHERSSSAEDAPTHSPCADLSALVENSTAGKPCWNIWSSLRKPDRAVSLSSASLVSPARALADVYDEHDGAEDVVRGDNNRASMGADDGAHDGEAYRVEEVGHTPAPLPVTPERPMQARFFRCSKPHLQLGRKSKSKSNNNEEGGAVVATTVEKGAVEMIDEPIMLHVCDNVLQENSIVATTPPSPGEDVDGRGEEAQPVVHVPRVLDMNTTLLGDGDDVDDDVAPCEGCHAECSLSHPETVLSTVAAAAAALTAENQNASVSEAVRVSLEDGASTQNAVLTSIEVNCEFRREKPDSLAVVQRDANASMPLPSAPSDAATDAEDGCFSDMSASVSPNTSVTDSRASSETSSGAALQRVATAAPVTMPLHSSRPSTTTGYHHHDSQASLSSLTSANTSGVEKKKETEQRERILPSPARTDESDGTAKHVSMSSGRGQNSSYGCTEGMNSPASLKTRQSTPQIEEEEFNDREAAGRCSNSPVVVAPSQEATVNPAEVLIESNPHPAAVVVPLDVVHVRIQGPLLAAETAEWMECQSQEAQYRTPLEPTRAEARRRLWKSALSSVESLVAEYQESLLATVMKAFGDAWLPPTPPTGLHHVNSAALLKPPYAPRNRAKTLVPPPPPPLPGSVPVPGRGSACTFPVKGLNEMLVIEQEVRESELSFLFQLYLASPSETARVGLMKEFFRHQHQRHVNWINHLMFEVLYVRMVAVRAMQMLEMHERRLTCMRRDVGIRDKIELFVLLAPRPRAPTLAASRGVFSAFRMVLHALTGNNSGQSRSRTNGSAKKDSSNSSIHAPTAASRRPPPPPPPPPALAAAASSLQRSSLQTKKGDTATRTAGVVGNLEPLFATERCGSGKYSVPVVCELTSRPASARGRGASSSAASTEADKDSEDDNDDDAAMPTVREVTEETEPFREPVDGNRGAPRPLNKTYSDYYKMIAEKSTRPSLFSDIHLPLLRRTGSRTSAAAFRRASKDKSDDGEAKTEDAAHGEKVGKLDRLLSRKSSRPPRQQKDREFSDGRLRAREIIAAKQRTRTPPRTPTEAEFVDLRDEEVLRRFVR
ncbi:hypothetical protein ABB37_05616 [Leptomonas pyrrhocoris]|uniref:Uncharacterized protein n=1 Tax=Leptomonas pyrrhocoris TaxID=157538 RepID=A0A0N0DUL8_LEPPY|nr:hypothetical protein ABB37_05616 [Leptomonas pyrrhocoris]KPA79091.1 hypothetical protein ABB37_05616 [Leptomonas pyrrhocoris]|eukprot:XP_015657530.1 hypothetical protein ABB37_05616 [Leptomonas pyrrhocoris]